jgi:hypothetical protein
MNVNPTRCDLFHSDGLERAAGNKLGLEIFWHSLPEAGHVVLKD